MTTHFLMTLLGSRLPEQNKGNVIHHLYYNHYQLRMYIRIFIVSVSLVRVLKAFSLANVSILFTLPMLVWGNTETSAKTRTIHYLLVFGYSFVVFLNVFTGKIFVHSYISYLYIYVVLCQNRALIYMTFRGHLRTVINK